MSQKSLPVQELSSNVDELRSIDCKSGKIFHGKGILSFQSFPRICEEILKTDPSFNVVGKGVDWEFWSWVDLSQATNEDYRIKVSLHFLMPLVCQRCMQAYEERVDISSQFILLDTEDEVDLFPIDNDLEDALLNSHHFDLIELIEDEIFLGLPFIPRHDSRVCHSKFISSSSDESNGGNLQQDVIENSSENSFASLKSIKFNA
jgi:uncharacterized protein